MSESRNYGISESRCFYDLLIDGAKIRRFFYSHNTFSMLFTYHIYGILS